MTIQVIDANGVKQTITTLDDLISIVALAAKQDAGNTSLTAILAKISADPATQTTMAAVLAKLSSDPASQTTLAQIHADLQQNHTDELTLHADIATTLHGDLVALNAGTKDAGPAWASVWGVGGVPFASADQHAAVASVTDAPTVGQKLVIDDLIVSVDTAMSVTFKEETTGNVVFGPWYLPANSGPIQFTPRGKKKMGTADKKLQVITSVAGNVTVQAGYHSEA
jgi:hypothetical protein